ncbi:phosphatidate cytidylyltransferase [Deltaproteobacteria bacterium OttesenSCG-928-M10]|nr:phosphatidate cytidylyltransferase [Deltaproteobacteria bacterium OttesenSCG-928-M10]
MSDDKKEIKLTLGGHKSRWIVAVPLLALAVWSMLADEYLYFFIVVLLAGGATWWEFSRNLFGVERVNLMLLAQAGWLAVAGGSYFYGPSGQSFGLVLALALGAFYTMWALEKESGPVLLNLLSRFALGHLYLSFLMSFFLLLKKSGSGGLWLVYVLAVTVAADTFAYYVGTKFGGPKLWPKISPNKTVSGLVGGAVGAMIVSSICTLFLPAALGILAPLGLFLGLWGAVGDLFESAIKRAIDIKDTSTLLLGHGGFWDRLDSLLFNIVPVYVLADFIYMSS